MTPTTTKVLTIGGILLTILLLVSSAYMFYIHKIHLEEQQKAIETQVIAQKELTDGILRAQSQYASKKDIEDFAKQHSLNFEAIRKDLAKLQATPTTITATTISTPGVRLVKVASTSVLANPNPPIPIVVNGKETFQDPYGYLKKAQILDLYENFGVSNVPFGRTTFSSWNEKPWDLNVYPRQYKVVSVIGTDKNQRNVVYNTFTVGVDGKDYPVQISSSETKQLYPEASFTWLNPKLFIGFDGAYNFTNKQFDYSPNLSLALSSYGKFVTSPDFTFFHIGAGYSGVERNPIFTFSPVFWNLGKQFPFMSNTYIGPSLGLGIHGSYSLLAGVKVSL